MLLFWQRKRFLFRFFFQFPKIFFFIFVFYVLYYAVTKYTNRYNLKRYKCEFQCIHSSPNEFCEQIHMEKEIFGTNQSYISTSRNNFGRFCGICFLFIVFFECIVSFYNQRKTRKSATNEFFNHFLRLRNYFSFPFGGKLSAKVRSFVIRLINFDDRRSNGLIFVTIVD